MHTACKWFGISGTVFVYTLKLIKKGKKNMLHEID